MDISLYKLPAGAAAAGAGRNVRLMGEDDPLASAQYLAVAEIGGDTAGGGNDIVRSAASLNSAAVERYLKEMIMVGAYHRIWCHA